MKLEKVIEELTAEGGVAIRAGRRELHDALQIAIGALERVIRHREMHLDGSRPILPGETEE